MADDAANFKKPYYERDDRGLDSAMPEFMAHELFGKLIPSSADPIVLEQLGNRTAGAWMSGKLDLWHKRVVTAFELLRRVPSKDFPKLVEIIELTVQSYYSPQKSAYFTGRDRTKKATADEPEERFPALFQAYQYEFENLYRHVATIFAFAKEAAFGQTQTVKSAQWWLEQSAKTKAGKLDTPLTLGVLPLNTLISGYHRHFRNAIAHARYKFIDRDTVEMWDLNERGKETWRQKLSYGVCEEKLIELTETISVMEAAYFLFEMNNPTARAATSGGATPPQLSAEERHNIIYMLAKKRYNLEVIGLQDDGASVQVTMKIIPNFSIPQTSKIYIGGDSGSTAFDVDQTVDAVPLSSVVFGYVRALRRNLGELKQLTLDIQGENGQDAGRLTLTHDQIEFLNTADDRTIAVEDLPVEENSLHPRDVKFTRRGRPRPSQPKPSTLVLPPPKRIIIP